MSQAVIFSHYKKQAPFSGACLLRKAEADGLELGFKIQLQGINVSITLGAAGKV